MRTIPSGLTEAPSLTLCVVLAPPAPPHTSPRLVPSGCCEHSMSKCMCRAQTRKSS